MPINPSPEPVDNPSTGRPPQRPVPPVIYPPSAAAAGAPTYGDFGITEPGNGKAIALAYGTVKLTAVLIEHAAPTVAGVIAWTASHQWNVGDRRYANGNTYTCTVAGMGGTTAPSGTGSDIVDGAAHWQYIQASASQDYWHLFVLALCEGPVEDVLRVWWDKAIWSGWGPCNLAHGLASNDNLHPSIWPAPWTYNNTALLVPPAAPGINTGSSSDLPSSIQAEVVGLRFGATTPDVNAADIITDLLTHTRRGVAWPASRIADLTQCRTYGDAAGLRLSVCFDAQQSVLDMLSGLMAATNCDAIWSGGQVKIVPRGDTAITLPVYGSTAYTPANGSVANLGPDDLKAPVQIQRRASADSYNSCPVTYLSRADDYSEQTVDDPEVADIQRRALAGAPNGGKNAADPQQLGVVMAPESAIMLSRLWAQRSVNCRNTYTFKLGWRWILLEPTDVVTISDPIMGLVNQPVRITSIEEEIDDQGESTLTVTAEDWPAGIATAARWTPQAGDGYRPNATSSAQVAANAAASTADSKASKDLTNVPGGSVSAPLIGTGALRTGTYTEDGSGNPTSGSKIDNAAGGTQVKTATQGAGLRIGGATFTDYWYRLVQAIDGASGGLVVWRGNIDTTVNGGVPYAREPALSAGLAVNPRIKVRPRGGFYDSVSGNVFHQWRVTVQPLTNADNLESLRRIALVLFDASGNLVDTDCSAAITDRAFQYPLTPTQAGNSVVTDVMLIAYRGADNLLYAAQPRCWNGYVRARLYNAYGYSAEVDFGPANTRSSDLAVAVIPSGSGYTPPSSGSGGGSSGGGGCPAPWMKVTLESGLLVDAADLYDGARVVGATDDGLFTPAVGTVRSPRIEWRQRRDVVLADGSVLAWSETHRLAVVGRGWVEVRALRPGDQLVGPSEAIVKAVSRAQLAQVVSFTVDGPHTYFAGGVLNHNTKVIP